MHRSASFALLVTAVVLFLLSSSANARVTRQKRQTTISSSCYSPTGRDCYWYRNCLEKRVPCQGTSDDYAIAYAEKFCNVFGSNYNRFSSQGKQWVDAVRKCLQVALVPLLRAAPPCRQIKSTAFNSHFPCYMTPGGGALGVCDLPVSDILVIQDIISSAWVSESRESLKGAALVTGGCTFHHFPTWVK
ncbi:uncharacterized protein LOC112558513 [Pomacea canaliculata]|uniref:uncharacterized protein LOC112558513 n=1 Tax=Pomacea canaliculata TaxID=400727 RepID=UPI000D72DD7D|nr:uncharacterized protein LOC112558513 [Pomacea canaliculata]